MYENRCQHQGGRFVRDIEDEHIATCSRHGWKIDARTGHYVNPPSQGDVPSFRQPRYRTAFSRDGDLEIYACDQPAKSGDVVQFRDGALVSFQKLRELKVGELTITYYGHACVVVKCGDFKIATDPWLVGDCFVGGWYPLHKPPKSWASELATVDMIYISHRHPDHYHPETLKHISKMNPQIPVIVGLLSNGSVTDSFLPFGTVLRQALGVWHVINDDLRIAILEDGALNDLDTSLLIEYKGHTIFNYVDCGNPNFGQLGRFDVILGDFAAGASGFPMCMEGAGKYTEAFIKMKKLQMNTTYLDKTIDIVQKTKPKIFIPFAGYFCEQRPEDGRIRVLNTKNTPEDVVHKMSQRFGDKVDVYVPVPGHTLDLAKPTPKVEYPGPEHFAQYNKREISQMLERYRGEIRHFVPFNQHRDAAFQFYFKWAGFQSYDLVLQVQECDDDFKPNGNVFYVDFRDGLEFPSHVDLSGVTFEKLFVRRDAFRYCLRFGLGWDSFFIGFSTRIKREPDVYHFKLWNHMSNKLPQRPPDWVSFASKFEVENDVPEFSRSYPRLCLSLFFLILALTVHFCARTQT